jgi:hypothetical protein
LLQHFAIRPQTQIEPYGCTGKQVVARDHYYFVVGLFQNVYDSGCVSLQRGITDKEPSEFQIFFNCCALQLRNVFSIQLSLSHDSLRQSQNSQTLSRVEFVSLLISSRNRLDHEFPDDFRGSLAKNTMLDRVTNTDPLYYGAHSFKIRAERVSIDNSQFLFEFEIAGNFLIARIAPFSRAVYRSISIRIEK